MDTLEVIDKGSSLKKKECKQDKFLSQKLPAYDSNLINLFGHDHDKLLDLYNEILASAQNKDYLNVQLLLVEFSSLFTDHISIEDQKLYHYLKILASDKSSLEQSIVEDFSHEMTKIADSIYLFLKDSPSIPVNKNNVEYFIEEFEAIGWVLQDRIKREEKVLYPIYKNNHN